MKIGLGIGERMVVLGLLPKEGNIITLKMLRGMVGKIGLTPEEITAFGVKQVGEQIHWDIKGNEPKDIEFADAESDLIRLALTEKNSKNKLTEEMISVYEKFVR
jgi:hypothetical protein